MKYYGKKSIPERLNHVEEIIATVAIDESLRDRLAVTGYEENKFSEVQQLLEVAQQLETNQQVQLGKQTAATNALKARTRTIRLKFIGDRKIVRHILRTNRPLVEELRLHIRTKEGREALIRQMIHFYGEVVKYEDVMALLAADYNLTAELFSSRTEEITALGQSIQAQQYQIGLVRVATFERQKAMKELDAWMVAFTGMARQAFRGEEANLRKLKVYVKPASKDKEEEEEGNEGDVTTEPGEQTAG